MKTKRKVDGRVSIELVTNTTAQFSMNERIIHRLFSRSQVNGLMIAKKDKYLNRENSPFQ